MRPSNQGNGSPYWTHDWPMLKKRHHQENIQEEYRFQVVVGHGKWDCHTLVNIIIIKQSARHPNSTPIATGYQMTAMLPYTNNSGTSQKGLCIRIDVNLPLPLMSSNVTYLMQTLHYSQKSSRGQKRGRTLQLVHQMAISSQLDIK